MPQKLNARSPYFISVATAGLTSAKLELEVYYGSVHSTWQDNPTYVLTSIAVNTSVLFEISTLVKDYIKAEFDGSYPYGTTGTNHEATTIYVDYRVTEITTSGSSVKSPYLGLKAFDGYGYFEDGSNPQNDEAYLQSNMKILKPDDAPLRIPIRMDNTRLITFLNKGVNMLSLTPSWSGEIAQIIGYVSNQPEGVDDFEDIVLNDGGTYEQNECLDSFLSTHGLYPVDKVIIEQSNPFKVYSIDVVNVEECKHTPYKITFINKFGAYQDIWMFKRADKNISTEKESYRANLVDGYTGNYNTYEHHYRTFNVNGKESLTLNSGFYPEENNEVFRQLLLSEKTWIKYNNQTLPITITSDSMAFQTKLNERLINYTLTVEFAFDKINIVR